MFQRLWFANSSKWLALSLLDELVYPLNHALRRHGLARDVHRAPVDVDERVVSRRQRLLVYPSPSDLLVRPQLAEESPR